MLNPQGHEYWDYVFATHRTSGTYQYLCSCGFLSENQADKAKHAADILNARKRAQQEIDKAAQSMLSRPLREYIRQNYLRSGFAKAYQSRFL